MKSKNLSLVIVSNKHKDLLFDWRNEKNAVKNSISNKTVIYNEHQKWFRNRLKIKPVLFWILKKNKSYVGVIRLDKKKIYYYLSYSIDRRFRKKGFGSKIIEKMLEKKIVKNILKKRFKIIAIVKKKNTTSIKAILSNNFYKSSFNKKILKLTYKI